MASVAPALVAVETTAHRAAAEELDAEYLEWVGNIAKIEVTFKDHFPLELVKVLQDGFVGLCATTSAGGSSRILLLHPTPHEYHLLTLQLRELESEGALTFVDIPRHAP